MYENIMSQGVGVQSRTPRGDRHILSTSLQNSGGTQFAVPFEKPKSATDDLDARIKKLGSDLDDIRKSIVAAIQRKDYSMVNTLLDKAASKPHSSAKFVELGERPGGLLLQYCCELFQLFQGDCCDTGLWSVIEVAAKAFFGAQVANASNEIRKIDESIAQLHGASGRMYAATMRRLTGGIDSNGAPKDNDFAVYVQQFDALDRSLPLPLPPLKQRTSDVCAVYQHGRVVAPMFQEFMEKLAKGSHNVFTMAPPKKIYRMSEKIGVRAKRLWDGATIVDAVRGTMEMGSMERGMVFLDYLQGADKRLGGDWQDAFDTKIHIVGIKNRWPPNKPAPGGWCCGQVYFSFLDDANGHVCELQIVHESMESVRKKIGNPAYLKFSANRSAAQLKAAAFPPALLPLEKCGAASVLPGSSDATYTSTSTAIGGAAADDTANETMFVQKLVEAGAGAGAESDGKGKKGKQKKKLKKGASKANLVIGNPTNFVHVSRPGGEKQPTRVAPDKHTARADPDASATADATASTLIADSPQPARPQRPDVAASGSEAPGRDTHEPHTATAVGAG